MKQGLHKILLFLVILIFPYHISILKGQGSIEEFGKNRVQYHNFVWSYIETENIVTYFYLGGQNIGKFTALIAEKELKDIEKELEYKISNKIDILVYNNLSDNNQSNIGVGIESDNTGGLTKIVSNKMFIYFDGNHQHLRRQIRQGIANIFINEMMFGGNLQEVLQNSVLLNLPDWYVNGLISYIGEKWSTDLDNRLRDGILSERYKKFNKLTGIDERYAGHFIWYYINVRYGEIAIPNILYLTRINRSLESGFLFVLGKSVKEIVNEWYEYYYDNFTDNITDRTLPNDDNLLPIKIKKKKIYSNVTLSPDGKTLAYISNEIGRYKLHLFNIKTGKSKVIMRRGFRTIEIPIDYDYPLLSWNPTGDKLTALYERRDKITLFSYDTKTKKKEKKRIIKFQEILSMSHIDKNTLVLSAVNRGQSDIYTYNIPSSRVVQITNDYHDDLQPFYVNVKDTKARPLDKKGILFISNRDNDTLKKERLDTLLPIHNFDIFFYDDEKKSEKLIRVTNTPLLNESMPFQYNSEYFTYLSNQNGIENQFTAYFDTVFSHYDTVVYFHWKKYNMDDSVTISPKVRLDSLIKSDQITITDVNYIKVYKDIAVSAPFTNYARNILEHYVSPQSKSSIEMIMFEGKPRIYKNPVIENIAGVAPPELINTDYRNLTLIQPADVSEARQNNNTQPVQNNDKEINTDNYYFQSEFKKESVFGNEEEGKKDSTQLEKKKKIIKISRARPYRVKLSSDYVVSQLDNRLIFTGYQPFDNSGFVNPDLNAMINVSVSDLMEDHRFVGGFRLPVNFRSMEYFFTYNNLKKRLDKKILYYRKNDLKQSSNYPLYVKLKTNYWQLRLSWPIDIIRSIRGSMAYRNEKDIYQATDFRSLELDNEEENWVMAKMEYVFDNTIKVALNILNGTRYKVYVEQHKMLDIKETYFSVVGLDFRHYERIHRQIVFANRLTAATSFGKKKVLYYLGGVDNWLFPKVNQDFPISINEYGFQALATNLRGFSQNVRHGNSYALINSEIRIPIFSYLINSPIKSSFIRNFQIVGFGDIGAAWEGASPYMKDNPLTTNYIPNPPDPEFTVNIKVYHYKNPIVAGYGCGIRSYIFGYFIRVDYAWGFEDNLFNKPMWHISLSKDF